MMFFGKSHLKGWVKCNVDVGVHRRLNFRDHEGNFVAAFASWTDAVMQVKEGEAVVLLGVIKWVNIMGFQHANFETDCRLLIDIYPRVLL